MSLATFACGHRVEITGGLLATIDEIHYHDGVPVDVDVTYVLGGKAKSIKSRYLRPAPQLDDASGVRDYVGVGHGRGKLTSR
jgi:preprotein translocase subunit YajC